MKWKIITEKEKLEFFLLAAIQLIFITIALCMHDNTRYLSRESADVSNE